MLLDISAHAASARRRVKATWQSAPTSMQCASSPRAATIATWQLLVNRTMLQRIVKGELDMGEVSDALSYAMQILR